MVDPGASGQGRRWCGGLSTGGSHAPGAAPVRRLAVSGAWEGSVGNLVSRSCSLAGLCAVVDAGLVAGYSQFDAVIGKAASFRPPSNATATA